MKFFLFVEVVWLVFGCNSMVYLLFLWEIYINVVVLILNLKGSFLKYYLNLFLGRIEWVDF